jgi:hypothetical protein
MRTKLKKQTKRIIAVAVCVALLATGITCAIIFWSRGEQKTTQDWLRQFETSLEVARGTTDTDGNAVPTYIEREIEIKENEAVVAVYKQRLQIATTNGQITAYLAIEERYPTQETAVDDIYDEYYFADGVMYTRRLHGEEVQTSMFESEIGALLTVVSENMGNAKYDFTEANFAPLAGNAEIISHDGDMHRLAAVINADRYAQFFGQGTNAAGLSDITLNMQITGKIFDSLILGYTESGLNTTITITRHDAEPITAPEWAQ